MNDVVDPQARIRIELEKNEEKKKFKLKKGIL